MIGLSAADKPTAMSYDREFDQSSRLSAKTAKQYNVNDVIIVGKLFFQCNMYQPWRTSNRQNRPRCR